MKFHIITLGCKVNIYESEIMKEKLLQENFEWVDALDKADIIIINTCSVTNMADKKSRKMVNRAKRSDKILVVCGCSSENKQEEYQKMGIDILIGNKDKSNIATLIKNFLSNHQQYTKFYPNQEFEFEDMSVEKFTSHTRAFIKIQDGCNNYCSYCIIPYVRKNLRNKPFAKAIEEAKTLVKNHHYEIVLTGIHTGSYKGENGEDLADLITEMSKIKDLKRIRISSIEITELNDKMLDVIQNNPKVVPHMHIPLQAGSDSILKVMNRKYNLEEYKQKIKEIRSLKEDISITTDVIVGHPYETEELFLKTIQNCQEIGFSKIHVFPYSKRDGTAASRMSEQVPEDIKKDRSRKLNAVSDALEAEYYKKHIGTNVEVLIEEVFDTYSIGFTGNYIKVRVNEILDKNAFYEIKAIGFENNMLLGEVIYKKEKE